MRPEKIEIFIDDQVITWSLGSDFSCPSVKENQKIKIKIYLGVVGSAFQEPKVDIEDDSVPLLQDDCLDEEENQIITFSSTPDKIFRYSFGIALLRIYVQGEAFVLPFEVLASKSTANQAESMIRYLMNRREHIAQICLPQIKRPLGIKDAEWSDAEITISTAEKIVNSLLEYQGELRLHIRSKLVPTKVPAWKAKQSGCLIDPVDVILNLDSLRPADGQQDVMLRGRNYSTSAIDITALVKDMNVQENTVLIGGLYSIRRVILTLMDDIGAAFKGCRAAVYDKDYIRFDEMLMRLTGGVMYERCERLIFSVESLIGMIEREFEIKFSGEIYPKMTPYVRSSRFYRGIFEQYVLWYSLGSPLIERNLLLTKLHSLPKIFEFFVLFKLIDSLSESGWDVVSDFDKVVPDKVVFQKNKTRISLLYEQNIYKFSGQTRHMALVKLTHSNYPGINWSPDYVVSIESMGTGQVRHIILDAKYSDVYFVEKFYLDNVYDKYYNHMAVFDKNRNFISKKEIMGVFIVFPEKFNNVSDIVNIQHSNFGAFSPNPTMIPMVAGLPISFTMNEVMDKWLNEIIDETMRSIND